MKNKLPDYDTVSAVLYARVSSKEQEREGYSIPSQLKLLREYAAKENIKITEEYVDIETAKRSGRVNFEKMVHYLRRHKRVKALLVEKTDRLYRNLKDWVTIDELDIEIHFAKEGTVLAQDSRSSEKFMHGIKVLMAKNYIDNLSEETRKGMIEKAEQGVWPSFAPLGYLNVAGENGKRIIETDPVLGPMITCLFEWYCTGRYSLRQVSEKARQAGLIFRKSGKPVPTSSIHKILRNRLYTGVFEWRGKLYKGSHELLIPFVLWERVQGVLDGRNASKIRGSSYNFAFTGLVTCGHCGCAMVAEIKKKKYIYYHCSGYKGKCDEPYTREEVLEEHFTALLKQLRFDDEVFEWIRKALKDSCSDKVRAQTESYKNLEKERGRLQRRLDEMYIDKLDGKVTEKFYNRMHIKWSEEKERCFRDMELYNEADESYMEDGIELLRLAKDAHVLFEKQPPEEKSKMLDFILSNCSWKNGKLYAEFKQPFDLLAETVANDIQSKKAGIQNSDRFEKWLPEQDSNLRQID
ncbi:recombinase family protein [Paremcibacter congregatus]|uniref:Recombinase family protein n=2 Tax=Paremcibacter congregatus TaxID=2043170 RepID=A0A2G4YR42_9PROT|nr:recombinase family protein [Paremcibacter congregatus]QDE29235.1 recombinase family protein [Paremcibacter congregatus]